MTATNQREYGPSWEDFRRHLAEVAKAHSCAITVEIGQTSPKTGAPQLYFRVVSRSRLAAAAILHERGEGHVWPASDWKTVPSMLMALLHRLDWRLTEQEQEAERQARF